MTDIKGYLVKIHIFKGTKTQYRCDICSRKIQGTYVWVDLIEKKLGGKNVNTLFFHPECFKEKYPEYKDRINVPHTT